MKLWLPTKRIEVSYGGRTRVVIIPSTGDLEYDRYLEEAQKEKTLEELKKLPPKPERTTSVANVAGMLREYAEFRNRKRKGDIKRFY